MNESDENIREAVTSAGLKLEDEEHHLVLPKDEGETARLFLQASKYGLKMTIRGRMTQSPPKEGRLVVGSGKLKRMIQHSPRDLLLVAEAGTAWSEVNQTAAAYGWTMGDYPGTLGGFIAGKADSKMKRELISRVLGLTLVTPQGKIYRLGSRAVKDVAGYRIFPLLVASEGRMGMITEVILNLARITRDFTPIGDNFSGGKNDYSQAKILLEKVREVFDPAGILS